MVLGVLSVITATRQHLDVVMLKSPLSVRLWLSLGQLTDHHGLPRWNEAHSENKYEKVAGIKELPLESSVMSLKAATLPRYLLDLSVVAFMIGIGLYELSGWRTWRRSLSAPNSSSNEQADDESVNLDALYQKGIAYRNVLIVFATTLTLCLGYWFKILEGVDIESWNKNEDFGASKYGKGENKRLTRLRQRLRRVQREFKLVPPDVPESDEADVVTVLRELSRDLKDRDEQWRQIFAHAIRQPPNQLRRTMSL